MSEFNLKESTVQVSVRLRGAPLFIEFKCECEPTVKEIQNQTTRLLHMLELAVSGVVQKVNMDDGFWECEYEFWGMDSNTTPHTLQVRDVVIIQGEGLIGKDDLAAIKGMADTTRYCFLTRSHKLGIRIPKTA